MNDAPIAYNPYDWYWLVKETNQYWSSKISTYILTPDQTKLTNIDTEEDLSLVLQPYGLQGPYVLVPLFVTNYQGRAALLQAGLFQQVDQAVQALGNTSMEYQAWEYATNFYRNSPFITSLGSQLGLTSDQIDKLFITADKIN